MARFEDPTEEHEAQWNAWLAERPPHVQAIASRFNPWTLYRMKSTGHRVEILSFQTESNDDPSAKVSLTVAVLPDWNLLLFGRQVFGVDPSDLEECDLPGPDEPTGSTLSFAQQVAVINAIRAENSLPPLTQNDLPDGPPEEN